MSTTPLPRERAPPRSRSRSERPGRDDDDDGGGGLKAAVDVLRRRFRDARAALREHGSVPCQQTHFAEELVKLADGGGDAQLRSATRLLRAARRLDPQAALELRRRVSRTLQFLRAAEEQIWATL